MASTVSVDVACPRRRCEHVEFALLGISINAIESGTSGLGFMMDTEILNAPELTAKFTAHYIEAGHV